MRVSITFDNGVNVIRECRCFTVYPRSSHAGYAQLVLHFEDRPQENLLLEPIVSIFALPEAFQGNAVPEGV